MSTSGRDPSQHRTAKGAHTVQRILKAASRRFGISGFAGASVADVARDAGVSKGLLHYHFESKEHLLLEAQRATFRQLHSRFLDRARRGDGGLPGALDALDALWGSVRELRGGAPFLVETASLASQEGPLRDRLASFYSECTGMLEDAIERLFGDKVGLLAVPPDRMALIIRLLLEGLVVELALARSAEDLARIDQAYADMRRLFERFALAGTAVVEVDPASLEPIPLPW